MGEKMKEKRRVINNGEKDHKFKNYKVYHWLDGSVVHIRLTMHVWVTSDFSLENKIGCTVWQPSLYRD